MRSRPRILPPVWMLLALLAMTGLHYFAPVREVISTPWSYLGALILLAGIALAVAGSSAFARAGTPVVPFERSTALVTGGLFRYSRNPMYLGLLLVLLGAAILFGTLSAFLPVILFGWIIHTRFVLAEERFLAEIFGAQYEDYRRRVRRWL